MCRVAVGAGILLTWLSGCAGLTDVSAPDVVQPAALGTAAGGATLWAGAVSRFTDAYSRAIPPSGELTDELSSTVASGTETDQRNVQEGALIAPYPYTDLHTVRIAASQAIAVLQSAAPQPGSRVGQLFALTGLIELTFAEQVCAGIPLGEIQNGQPIYGQPLTSEQMLRRAVADFDSALVYATDSVRIANLARVGRGRALLDLGEFADAAAAVASVPTAYQYRTEHSASVQPNPVFDVINNQKRSTVGNHDGGNGLDYQAAGDPRVPTQLLGKGVDGVTALYAYSNYSSLASPIVVASGTEARLIEAEAALHAGNAAGALATLNALRATVSGLAPLMLQPTDEQRLDQLFRERAFWLFLTGHRQGDLRRLVRQYHRSQDSVFPSGPYKTGLTFGTSVNFAPSPRQRENPNYEGCADRDA